MDNLFLILLWLEHCLVGFKPLNPKCDALLQQIQLRSNWQLNSASQAYKFFERKAYADPQDKLTGRDVFGLM